MVVILDNVRSLHNVGSIFRTADAAGVEKIYLCGVTPSPTDRFGGVREQLTKVSLGAEKYLDWEKCVSTPKLVAKLKKEGFTILALEQSEKSIPYGKIPSRTRFSKIALVVGNEVEGLPVMILKKSDMILEIPMHGKKESLNVGVAFGIVAFALRDRCEK